MAESTMPPVEDDRPEPLPADLLTTANRHLRELVSLDAVQAEADAVRDDEQARIDQWYADRVAGIADRRQYLSDQLTNIIGAVHERTGSKTLNLPWGRVSMRTPPVTVQVTCSASELPDEYQRIKATVEPDRQAMKRNLMPGPVVDDTDPEVTVRQAITADGEAVPGVVFHQRTSDDVKVVPS